MGDGLTIAHTKFTGRLQLKFKTVSGQQRFKTGFLNRFHISIARFDNAFLHEFHQRVLSITIPYCLPVCIAEGIWKVLPSRVRLEIAGVTIKTSKAATRPPPFFGKSVCAITSFRDSDNITLDVLLAVGGELVNNAVNGRSCRRGVQRSDNEMNSWLWKSINDW